MNGLYFTAQPYTVVFFFLSLMLLFFLFFKDFKKRDCRCFLMVLQILSNSEKKVYLIGREINTS